MKPRLTIALSALSIALGALALSGCASSKGDGSKKGTAPVVKQEVTPSGEKLVSVQPYYASCTRGQFNIQDRYQCPVIGADWTSTRAGIARMTIGVPGLKDAEVTGADFHIGASEVVRVRNKSSVQSPAGDYSVATFDVPLTFVEKLAYGARSWVRVYTGERFFDATVNSGEDTARAVEGLAYFMTSVDQVSGRTPSESAQKGGLLDRLGLGGNDSSGARMETSDPR